MEGGALSPPRMAVDGGYKTAPARYNPSVARRSIVPGGDKAPPSKHTE
jgi:hypothetical protein